MKRILGAAAFGLLCATSVAASGKIERACNNSDRTASASVCKCIQIVANSKLTRSDQRLAAKFFRDPHLAQETRQSDDAAKESFWKRYKSFGQAAAKTCS